MSGHLLNCKSNGLAARGGNAEFVEKEWKEKEAMKVSNELSDIGGTDSSEKQ